MTIAIVYNADAGLFNAIADSIRKTLFPKSYECALCAITHGAFGAHRDWEKYLEDLGYPIEFYHRDEFIEAYGRNDLEPPVILADRGGELDVLLTAAEIHNCRSIEELKIRLDGALADRAT